MIGANLSLHDLIVVIVTIVVTAAFDWTRRRLGIGFGKFLRSRQQAARYYADAPLPVLIAHVGSEVCWAVLNACGFLLAIIILESSRSTDTFFRYFTIPVVAGLSLFGIGESLVRLVEIRTAATEAWNAAAVRGDTHLG